MSRRVPINADDLIQLAVAAKKPIKVTHEALPILAFSIRDAFDRFSLVSRGHRSTAHRGAVSTWVESLEQWIEDGTTLLGGNHDPRASAARASIAGDATVGRLHFDARRWFAGKMMPRICADRPEPQPVAQENPLVLLIREMKARTLPIAPHINAQTFDDD